MKLGTYGSVCLIVTLIITKALISTPALYVQQSMSAGWLEVLISGVFECFVLCIILKIMLRFDGMDIIDIYHSAFGNIGKIISGLISCSVIVVSCAAVSRSFAELIRNTTMRGNAYENILVFLLFGGLIAANLGLKTQSNLNGLILPCTIVLIVIVIFINLSRYSVTNIQPLFGNGVTDVAKNALFKNASYFEIGILLFILPYLGEKKSVKQIGFTSLILSIFLITLITLTYQLAVPYEAAETFSMPLYQLTRMLKPGTFFQRIEPLNVFLWGGVMFVYTGVGIWLSGYLFKKTFSLSDDKPLNYIFTLIIGLLALLPGSETSVERIYNFLMTYLYVAYPLIPLILLIIASVFSKKIKQKG